MKTTKSLLGKLFILTAVICLLCCAIPLLAQAQEEIEGNAALVVSIDYSGAAELAPGQREEFSVTVSGGVYPYQFHFCLYKNNTLFKDCGWDSVTNYRHEFLELGSYKMGVVVKDNTGIESAEVFSDVITVKEKAVFIESIDFACDDGDPIVGKSAWYRSNVYGGEPPYKCYYYIYKDGEPYEDLGWETPEIYSFPLYSFPEPGVYKLRVIAKDNAGITTAEKYSNTITVVNGALDFEYRGYATSSWLGMKETFSGSAYGGKPPYQTKFQVYKDNKLLADLDWQQTSFLWQEYTFSEVGTYKLCAVVKDSLGTIAKKYGEAITVSSIPLSIVSAYGACMGNLVGYEATYWSQAAGGKLPYQYHYQIYKDDKLYQTVGWSTVDHFNFTYTEPGVYKLRVYAKDSLGAESDAVFSDPETIIEGKPVIDRVYVYPDRDIDQPSTFDVTAYGGKPPYSYQYYMYKDGKPYKSIGWKKTDSYTFSYTYPGEYRMRVTVKDSKGTQTASVFSSVVTVTSATPIIANVATQYTARNTNQYNKWTVTAAGGTGALQYHYRIYKDNVLYKTVGWKNESSYNFKFTEPGVYKMRVIVKDAEGTTSATKYSPVITVTKTDPAVSKVATQYTTSKTAQSNKWTVAASGGMGALQYHYRLYKDNVLYKTIGWKTASSYTHTFTEAGVYKMRVIVKDSEGTASATEYSPTITVTKNVPVLSKVATQYTTRTTAQSNKWTVTATGGMGALQYHYRLYKDDVLYKTIGWKAESTYTFKFTEAGVYKMRVIVKDSEGVSSATKYSPVITVTKTKPAVSKVATQYTARTTAQSNKWTVTATGGTGTLQYHYRLYKDDVLYKTIGWKTASSYTHTFTEAGVYKMRVIIKDSEGVSSATKYSPVITVTKSKPAVSKVATQYTARTTTQSNKWTVTASGGTGTLQYHYRIYKDDVLYKTIGWKPESTYTFKFTEAGVYKMRVIVKDSEGTTSATKYSPVITVTE